MLYLDGLHKEHVSGGKKQITYLEKHIKADLERTTLSSIPDEKFQAKFRITEPHVDPSGANLL